MTRKSVLGQLVVYLMVVYVKSERGGASSHAYSYRQLIFELHSYYIYTGGRWLPRVVSIGAQSDDDDDDAAADASDGETLTIVHQSLVTLELNGSECSLSPPHYYF